MKGKSLFCTQLLCVFLLFSCINFAEKNESENQTQIELDYAKGFKIYLFDNYKKVEVFDPSIGKKTSTYYLVKDRNVKVPIDGEKLLVPIRNIAVTSATHIGFIDALSELKSVSGVCSPQLIYNQKIKDIDSLVNIGDAFNLNFEKLFFLHPEALTLTLYGGETEKNKRIKQGGIPILYINEWKEQHPLARAEWIKFFGAIYDKSALADSLFEQTRQRYEAIRSMVKNTSEKPKVMIGGSFKGTWYVPGGMSFMGELLKDASCSYVFENDSTAESIPLSVESVLYHFSQADVWLGAPSETMDLLLNIDERNQLFNAVNKGNVYNFYARKNSSGGNDFWESGVVYPDKILSDFAKIIHPNISKIDTLYFSGKLK